MSERTESFTPPVVGKVPPGAPLHEEEKMGKMPSGRTVREIPSEKASPKEQRGEEATISRLSQGTIASPPESKKGEHSITQTGEKSPSEKGTEKARQVILPLARSAEGITSSAGTLP